MFSETSVSHSVQGGMGFPACITDHMTGGSASRGVCIRGRVVCIQEGGGLLPGERGLHPGGGLGRPLPPPRYMGYYGIRSTSGRYASYWNAFLYYILLQL